MRLHSRPQCWRSYAPDFVRSNTEELWDGVGLSGFARRISTSSPGFSCFPKWRWAGNQGNFERLLLAIIFVKTHCILDLFSSYLPSQSHTSFSERTIDTFPKILCLGLSSSLRGVDRKKFGIHFALLENVLKNETKETLRNSFTFTSRYKKKKNEASRTHNTKLP